MELIQILSDWSEKMSEGLSSSLQKIKVLDAFSIPISPLNINSKSTYRSLFSVVITVAIGILMAMFLVINYMQIKGFKNLKASLIEKEVDDKYQPNSTLRMFSIKVDNLKYSQFLRMFELQAVQYVDGKSSNNPLEFTPCKEKDWPALGPNLFKSNKLNQTLCPQKNGRFYLQGSYWDRQANFIKISLKKCDKEKAPYCNLNYFNEYISNRESLTEGVYVRLFLYDFQILEQEQNPVKKKVTQKIAIFNTKKGDNVYLQFSRFVVQTNFSIFSWQQNQKTENESCLYEERFTSVPIVPLDRNSTGLQLVSFTLSASKMFKHYKRSLGQLEQPLIDTGGLLFMIIGFLGFFVGFYNEYNRKICLATAFLPQYQDMDKRPNSVKKLLRYLAYSVLSAFSIKMDWKDCKQIQIKNKETEKLLEVDRILKRLENLQKYVNMRNDKNEWACLLLMQRASLKQIKLERLQVDYLSLILDKHPQTPGITISDIRKKHSSSQTSLKQLKQILIEQGPWDEVFESDEELSNLQVQKIKKVENMLVSNLGVYRSTIYFTQNNQTEKKRKKQFKKSKSDLQNLVDFLQIFPYLEQNSKKIDLSPIQKKVQTKFAKCFYNMKPSSRAVIQQKIPIVILIRLVAAIRQLRQKRQDERQKNKEKNKKQSKNEGNLLAVLQEDEQQIITPINSRIQLKRLSDKQL